MLSPRLPDNSGLARLVLGTRYHRAGAVFAGASSPLRGASTSNPGLASSVARPGSGDQVRGQASPRIGYIPEGFMYWWW
jgi:hypothetical protein